MSKVIDAVKESAEKLAVELGYELVDIDFSKKYGQMNLTFTLYKDGGISLDDCERYHQKISEILDKIDPTEDPYLLNVSSMGLDRPIKTNDDLRRNMNCEVELSLYAAQDKKKKFNGFLTFYNEEEVHLQDNGKEYVFKRKDIAVMKPAVKF